jgi:hypothetical protein
VWSNASICRHGERTVPEYTGTPNTSYTTSCISHPRVFGTHVKTKQKNTFNFGQSCGSVGMPPLINLGTRSMWSASRSGSLSPGKSAPSTNCIKGWVGLRASRKAVEKRKISCPWQESSHDSSAVQPVAHCYTDWAISAPSILYIRFIFLMLTFFRNIGEGNMLGLSPPLPTSCQ